MALQKICGIYKITSPSKKIYIGQSFDIKRRFRNYKRLHCKLQIYLYHSLEKYGVEKHKFEIIHICTPLELNELEKYYIELYQTFNSENGLNLRTGGHRGKWSNESKEKNSKAHKNKKPYIMTDEIRKNMSSAQKIISSERSLFMKNNTRTLGKRWKCSEEGRKNMSKMKFGNKNRSKKIIDVTTNIIYKEINEAAKIMGIKRTTLNAMLIGQNPNKTNLKYL